MTEDFTSATFNSDEATRIWINTDTDDPLPISGWKGMLSALELLREKIRELFQKIFETAAENAEILHRVLSRLLFRKKQPSQFFICCRIPVDSVSSKITRWNRLHFYPRDLLFRFIITRYYQGTFFSLCEI